MKGFPGSSIGREPACQCRSHKRHGFNPWVRKVPWRRAWQPTPVFSPGEPCGQRSLVGCSLQGCGELGVTEGTERAHVVLSPLGGASGAPGNSGPLCLRAGRVHWEAKWWIRSDSLEQDAWKGCGQARGCQARKGKVRRRERPPLPLSQLSHQLLLQAGQGVFLSLLGQARTAMALWKNYFRPQCSEGLSFGNVLCP